MSRRRPVRVLGLMLIVALLGSAFVANADAKKLSKAQKHAISKKLMRAVKHNPKVVTKRWFLKQASLVSFSLPATIRLDALKDQYGNHDVQNKATLDLGPSLGTRSIALTGNLHANINFNDAFDGGHLGDVRITLPPDPSATLSTTSVALLTNPNTTGAGAPSAPQDDINGFLLKPLGTPTDFTVKVGTAADVTAAIPFGAGGVTCGNAVSTDPPAVQQAAVQACSVLAHSIRDAVGATPTVGGTKNVYVVAAPAALAKHNNALNGFIAVNTLFTGAKNEISIGGYDWTGSPVSCLALGFPAPFNAHPGCKTTGSSSVLPTGMVLVKPFDLTSTPSTLQVPAQAHVEDYQGMGGCGNWAGNGATLPSNDGSGGNRASQDVDLPGLIQAADKPGDNNAIGNGLFSVPGDASTAGDVVLRTGALTLNVAAPTKVTVPGDNESNPGSKLADDYPGSPPLPNEIHVPLVDAPAFTVGQDLTITDGFNSSTSTVSSINASADPAVIGLGTPLGQSYPAGSIVSVVGDATVDKNVGSSGGRANLFGQPINGLAKGNSVDVTVNLATDINSIARQVDAATPPPFGGPPVNTTVTGGPYPANATSITVSSATGLVNGDVTIQGATGTVRGLVTNVNTGTNTLTLTLSGAIPNGALLSQTPETNGNINAYSDCRQAWTGVVRNYLTGIKLVGALRIAPALTADGKVRIAKVNLRTPAPVPESLAACLSPYQLYMQGIGLAGDPYFPSTAPQLIFGAEFNPLVVLGGSSEGVSPKPSAKCNASGGPLARSPFNSYPQANGATDLKTILSKGAAVGVSGTLSTAIKAEVLVGSY